MGRLGGMVGICIDQCSNDSECTDQICCFTGCGNACMDDPNPPSPRPCCRAMTAQCLSCAAGQTEAEYCKLNPQTVGCPRKCCKALTLQCLSCAADQTEEEYCADNPTFPDCVPELVACTDITDKQECKN